MLISVEHELPVVRLSGPEPVLPENFQRLWQALRSTHDWIDDGPLAVMRPRCTDSRAVRPGQVLTTDTGPTLEMVPTPRVTIDGIARQLFEMRQLVAPLFKEQGLAMLGSGIHPYLGATKEEYYACRTPRSAYDYAIRERGWLHWTLLNVASLQEVVDVPTESAPSILSAFHQLAGIFLFLFRHDPAGALLSVRPTAWRYHVPVSGSFADDRHKVWIPTQAVSTWRGYLRLLWDTNPMFLIGTKSSGLVYVPEHPTFARFISNPPAHGWEAKRLDTGETLRIQPDMTHVAGTDWTYMGFTRLRLFWQEETKLSDLVAAYQSTDDVYLSGFLREHLRKVLLENRVSATPPPGAEMASLAFLIGLLQWDGLTSLISRYPYDFWRQVARAAETESMAATVCGVPVLPLLTECLEGSRLGLCQRELGEEHYLEPLWQRLEQQSSPAEDMIRLIRKEGLASVVDRLQYRS